MLALHHVEGVLALPHVEGVLALPHIEGVQALPHVECVLYVPHDELHSQEVVLLAPVVEYQPLSLQGLELEVDVDLIVGLRNLIVN